MESFAAIIAFLIVGMVLRRLPAVPAETGTALNAVVIHVSLPALVLLNIPRLHLSSAALVPALMPWAMLALSAGLVLALSRALRWDRATTGCLLLMVPLGNTSFLGIPMVKAFFGEAGFPYALLYDQLGTFPALAIYGTLVVSAYGAGGARPAAGIVGRRIISFPPFIALLLALALRGMEFPPFALSVLSALASTLVPLVMIAVGHQLRLGIGRGEAGPLGIGLVIKMAAAPLVALAICRAAGLTGEAAEVSIFQSAMPPMVSAGALAMAAGLSPSLAAALAGVGIGAAFFTLPLLHWLL